MSVFNFYDDVYAGYLPVGYSDKKGKVVVYPDTSAPYILGLMYCATKCANGYYISESMINPTKKCDGIWSNILVNEYKEIWKTYKGDHRDTLTSRILDNDGYKEIYWYALKDSLLTSGGRFDINKINEKIGAKEFFTYKGVKRVK